MAFPPDQVVVILGTSRSDGNTRKVVEAIISGRPVEIVDLSQLRLSFYDYKHRDARDDFIPLTESIASKQLWILATPVHWYTMSAQLKTGGPRKRGQGGMAIVMADLSHMDRPPRWIASGH